MLLATALMLKKMHEVYHENFREHYKNFREVLRENLLAFIAMLKRFGASIKNTAIEMGNWLYENRYRILGGTAAIAAGAAAGAAVTLTGGLAAVAAAVGAGVTVLTIAAVKLTIRYYEEKSQNIRIKYRRGKIKSKEAGRKQGSIASKCATYRSYYEELKKREEDYQAIIKEGADAYQKLSEEHALAQEELAKRKLISDARAFLFVSSHLDKKGVATPTDPQQAQKINDGDEEEINQFLNNVMGGP